MCTTKYSLFWMGLKIGTVLNPRIIKQFLYGDWEVLVKSHLYIDFLKLVNEESGAYVEIVGSNSNFSGKVLVAPCCQVKIYLNESLGHSMNSGSQLVFWNDKKIGVIVNPRIDNFFLYGDWEIDENFENYNDFLDSINDEYGALVEIGKLGSGLKGNVLTEPDSEIDIRLES